MEFHRIDTSGSINGLTSTSSSTVPSGPGATTVPFALICLTIHLMLVISP
ncbi:MAG: hypothetical protein V8T82_11110 [Romboutsia timonensis]